MSVYQTLGSVLGTFCALPHLIVSHHMIGLTIRDSMWKVRFAYLKEQGPNPGFSMILR